MRLAGAYSAGKFSIMQPSLLWKQTLEAPFEPGPLLLNGPCVRFTAIAEIDTHALVGLDFDTGGL